MRFQRFLIAAVLSFGALAASAAPTHAVMIYATAAGISRRAVRRTTAALRRERGYCGHMAGWCSPANFQWTYSMYPQYSTKLRRLENRAGAAVLLAGLCLPFRARTRRPRPFTPCSNEVGSRSTYMVNQMAYSDQWAQLGGNHYLVSAVSLATTTSGGAGMANIASPSTK